jgi:hypothetical protein
MSIVELRGEDQDMRTLQNGYITSDEYKPSQRTQRYLDTRARRLKTGRISEGPKTKTEISEGEEKKPD